MNDEGLGKAAASPGQRLFLKVVVLILLFFLL